MAPFDSLEDDEDLKLLKASTTLLAELEKSIPRALYKPARPHSQKLLVHRKIKKRDLDYIVNLIEPFQPEPQLLDTKLKHILPPIVDAYTETLRTKPPKTAINHGDETDVQTAVCTLLYVLCKVRSVKVITGFLNNEPRLLEPILESLEDMISLSHNHSSPPPWQVPYISLLWLSHLLLAPFDLASISATPVPTLFAVQTSIDFTQLPLLAARIAQVGLFYISTSTKAQDAATALLVRLSTRPDIRSSHFVEALSADHLRVLEQERNPEPTQTQTQTQVYPVLGALKLLSRMTSAPELTHLIPSIFSVCQYVFTQIDLATSNLANAVAKKLAIKILRNAALVTLRAGDEDDTLNALLESTNVLEDVIDHLLHSLGDKDTPVRYAAAKSLSVIILALDAEMGQELIQALLDTFKEDMPTSSSSSSQSLDFTLVSPLKWHGLTLALAHTLFARSASPAQLPDILAALFSASQFQQRTATGTILGTNVRDAANFAIWSLARRYSTDELLSVNTHIHTTFPNPPSPPSPSSSIPTSTLHLLASHLLLTATLDPSGNIRRGSSAALQELIGRHPSRIPSGIPLVQIVDYAAVGLRARAMLDVANAAAHLHESYAQTLLAGLLGWRGLCAADVPARQAAAKSLAMMAGAPGRTGGQVWGRVWAGLRGCAEGDVDGGHGFVLALAEILDAATDRDGGTRRRSLVWDAAADLDMLLGKMPTVFSARVVASEMPVAVARVLAALHRMGDGKEGGEDDEEEEEKGAATTTHAEHTSRASLKATILRHRASAIDEIIDRILARSEEEILTAIPALVVNLHKFRTRHGIPVGSVGLGVMQRNVANYVYKNTLQGAGNAIALGALGGEFARDEDEDEDGNGFAAVITTLCEATHVPNIDWRIMGMRALTLVVRGSSVQRSTSQKRHGDITRVLQAVHHGLNDYTIDERGDVGSLMRLEALGCATGILAQRDDGIRTYDEQQAVETLRCDVLRLSLEKLDRVRLQAAGCRHAHVDAVLEDVGAEDVAGVSGEEYFAAALRALGEEGTSEERVRALLEGCISSAGHGQESLVQVSRRSLTGILQGAGDKHLEKLLTVFAKILQEMVEQKTNCQPALELLAFLLDMRLVQRVQQPGGRGEGFSWRKLLSGVQKCHFKSNEIPRILAAVQVYMGLAGVAAIRQEVLKKLMGMLQTNPYPRIRVAVAEALWVVTQEPLLREHDWAREKSEMASSVRDLRAKYELLVS